MECLHLYTAETNYFNAEADGGVGESAVAYVVMDRADGRLYSIERHNETYMGEWEWRKIFPVEKLEDVLLSCQIPHTSSKENYTIQPSNDVMVVRTLNLAQYNVDEIASPEDYGTVTAEGYKILMEKYNKEIAQEKENKQGIRKVSHNDIEI